MLGTKVFHNQVRESEAITETEFIMVEHGGKCSTDEIFEDLCLLVDKGLTDQSRMHKLIDQGRCQHATPLRVVALGNIRIGLSMTASGSTLLLISCLAMGPFILE